MKLVEIILFHCELFALGNMAKTIVFICNTIIFRWPKWQCRRVGKWKWVWGCLMSSLCYSKLVFLCLNSIYKNVNDSGVPRGCHRSSVNACPFLLLSAKDSLLPSLSLEPFLHKYASYSDCWKCDITYAKQWEKFLRNSLIPTSWFIWYIVVDRFSDVLDNFSKLSADYIKKSRVFKIFSEGIEWMPYPSEQIIVNNVSLLWISCYLFIFIQWVCRGHSEQQYPRCVCALFPFDNILIHVFSKVSLWWYRHLGCEQSYNEMKGS